ncbi:FixH family protein [Rhodoplanes roseus]|uniref:Heavy metal RND transporter n=1 Tax=Rhodoplanes roseus TaxID=29409 RepID=A0A327KZ93_9BRAD|nr:FixH family protein [Rhodoplanes roseus]RAI44200.1 heavy metal RND transporter [Rhodoplanes roseus]
MPVVTLSARRLSFSLAATALLVTAGVARADIKDYELQLVKAEVNSGDTVVAVRIVNKKTGAPVPDAVVFSKRLDMAPDNMASMVAPLEPAPAAEAGVYGFKTNISHPGRWQLSVAAKLQGETGTLQGRFVVKAVP